jgi:hypothetical protein
MQALHMPTAALRAIASFAELEFDVCLRDCALPFVWDAPAAVFASRVSPAGALLGAAARLGVGASSPATTTTTTTTAAAAAAATPPTGKLWQLVSFSAPPLSLPLALASYSARSGFGAEEEPAAPQPVLIDLSAFPPRQLPVAEAAGAEAAGPVLRRALAAVLQGAWAPWPASPRTLVAADTDVRGIRLFWLELPAAAAGLGGLRLLRTVCAALDELPFPSDRLPLSADPAGRYVYVAAQGLRAVTCVKVCARSGTVLASSTTEGAEPGHLTPLAPDLWLHLAGEDTALLSASAPARPQAGFWRQLAAALPDEREGRHTSHTVLLRERRRPLRMSRGRVLIPDPAHGKLLLAELRGLRAGAPAMHLRGPLPGTPLPTVAAYCTLPPLCEGPCADRLVLRAGHGRSLLVQETRGRWEARLLNALVVVPSQRAEDPRLAAVFQQAQRQKERRVAAAAAAAARTVGIALPLRRTGLGSPARTPGASAACPIDLTQE